MDRAFGLRLMLADIDGPMEGYKHPAVWNPSPSSAIGRARPAGWRILPCPRLSTVGLLDDGHASAQLNWQSACEWVAIPPDGVDVPARRFDGPLVAARWALSQAGQRGD